MTKVEIKYLDKEIDLFHESFLVFNCKLSVVIDHEHDFYTTHEDVDFSCLYDMENKEFLTWNLRGAEMSEKELDATGDEINAYLIIGINFLLETRLLD